MAEEFEGGGTGPEGNGAGIDPTSVVLALAGASRERADSFLIKQEALIAAQLHHLREQLEQIHLDVWEKRLGVWLRVATLCVGLAAAMGLAAALWNASRAEGIVVDAFSVPLQFAQAGNSGETVARDVTHQIAAINEFANTHSLARSKGVRENSDEIKIEIPETGVSVSQAWRYLRLWLGNEHHLSGDLREAGNNKIALSVALDGSNAATFTGASDELDRLELKAAEHIFGIEDHNNIVLYLYGKGRGEESLAAAARGVQMGGTPAEMADHYALWANQTRFVSGDVELSIARARIGIAIDPKPSAPHGEVLNSAIMLGHDEDALLQASEISDGHHGDDPAFRSSNGVAAVLERAVLFRETETGDFASAVSEPCIYSFNCQPSFVALQRAELAARMHDARLGNALISEAIAEDTSTEKGDAARQPANEASVRARYFLDILRGDWRAADADANFYAQAVRANLLVSPKISNLRIKTQVAPLLAYALVRGGNVAGAWAAIDATKADCYDCLRTRGIIAAFAGQSGRADYWFARAVHDAPLIPFAYYDWGRALLDRGQLDAAIPKFKQANQKGPHFADPLEGWGEALIAKYRSDLALAKFAEADKYATNWGRLHLKWGEALYYAGKKDEAKAQLTCAAALDLTPSEKTELARVSHD